MSKSDVLPIKRKMLIGQLDQLKSDESPLKQNRTGASDEAFLPQRDPVSGVWSMKTPSCAPYYLARGVTSLHKMRQLHSVALGEGQSTSSLIYLTLSWHSLWVQGRVIKANPARQMLAATDKFCFLLSDGTGTPLVVSVSEIARKQLSLSGRRCSATETSLLDGLLCYGDYVTCIGQLEAKPAGFSSGMQWRLNAKNIICLEPAGTDTTSPNLFEQAWPLEVADMTLHFRK